MRRIGLVLSSFVVTLSSEALGDGGPPGLLRIDPPAAEGALAPNLTPAEDGAFLTWLEPVQPEPFEKSTTYRLRCARFSGGAWSEPKTIVERDDLISQVEQIAPHMAAQETRSSGDQSPAFFIHINFVLKPCTVRAISSLW